MIKPVDGGDNIAQLVERMRVDLAVGETQPQQIERSDSEHPNSRQIAHPSQRVVPTQEGKTVRDGAEKLIAAASE